MANRDEQEIEGRERVFSREEMMKTIACTTDAKTGAVTSRLLDMLTSDDRGGLSGAEFTGASIFDPVADPFRVRVRECLALRTPWASGAEDRAVGAMLGMVIGDAIGARVEFMPVRYGVQILRDMGSAVGGSFQLRPGQWTDDSSMGLCVADSLLCRAGAWDPHDCMHRFLAWWHGGYNNAFRLDAARPWKHSVGLGGNISASFGAYLRHREPYTRAGDKETSGNGSVMRLAAVPVRYHDDIEKGVEVAGLHSLTTHQGEEAADCCRLLTHVMVRGINGEPIREVLKSVGETFRASVPSVAALAKSTCERDDENRDWRWMADSYKYSPRRAAMQPGYVGSYAMDATAMALHCAWSTASFPEAVLKAANLRGDADSVASVTGQIAGSFYGASAIPAEWITTVQQWDDSEVALRAYRLFNKHWMS
jgi:ADP-ribosylglycohydrolase